MGSTQRRVSSSDALPAGSVVWPRSTRTSGFLSFHPGCRVRYAYLHPWRLLAKGLQVVLQLCCTAFCPTWGVVRIADLRFLPLRTNFGHHRAATSGHGLAMAQRA